MTETRPRILPKRHTSLGWAVVNIHHRYVPGYDIEEAKKGLSKAGVETELECNWMASTGKVVYPEFNAALHLSPDPLEFDPRRVLFVGLDVPGTPAATVSQIDAFGRWCILSNLSPPEDETVGYYEFFEALADHLTQEYAIPAGVTLHRLKLQFFGDPAGNAKIPRPGQSPKEVRSCYDILRDGVKMHVGYNERGDELIEEKPGWGWRVTPGAVNITERLEAVRARLTTLLRGGVPALVIDPRCRTIIQGFSGAYCYRERTNGRGYDDEPFKGFHAHSMNCLEYIATRLFAPPPDDDEDDLHKHQVKSRAAGRRGQGGTS